MIRRFARPYARALMDAAGTAAKANEVRGELLRISAALKSSPELREMYASPAIDLDSKMKVTRAITSKMKLSELGAKMVEVLVRGYRINNIDDIITALTGYVNKELGVAVAEVRSAKSLNADEMEQLAAVLGRKVGRRVELDVRTDPALLGGFVAKIDSEIWDASVLGKITKFRENLS